MLNVDYRGRDRDRGYLGVVVISILTLALTYVATATAPRKNIPPGHSASWDIEGRNVRIYVTGDPGTTSVRVLIIKDDNRSSVYIP